MSDFGDYFLDELLTLKLPPREWLVEGLAREKDSVILVGNEKSGKSLFLFQLISSLTSGQPFLDNYPTLKPRKVTYIQLEGELNDSQDRFRRLNKTLEYEHKNCLYMFRPPLEMQDAGYAQSLAKHILGIWKGETPDVVIFDPIYFSFSGSLSDDEVVRKFIGNLRIFKQTLNCAIILVHHTHKQKWTNDGFTIEEGDEAIFGSKFFKAWADHILLFMYDKRRQVRILSCNTQRSGDIVKECVLKLIEPDPLYFEITYNHTVSTHEFPIVELLSKFPLGLTSEDIIARLNINKNVFYQSIKKPLTDGIVEKTEHQRPKLYRIKAKESVIIIQPGGNNNVTV